MVLDLQLFEKWQQPERDSIKKKCRELLLCILYVYLVFTKVPITNCSTNRTQLRPNFFLHLQLFWLISRLVTLVISRAFLCPRSKMSMFSALNMLLSSFFSRTNTQLVNAQTTYGNLLQFEIEAKRLGSIKGDYFALKHRNRGFNRKKVN